MTKAEVRRERDRLDRALRYIQRRLQLHLDFVLRENGDVSLLTVQPSDRGVEDPVCFLIEFNPDTVSALTLRELRSSALHETLHAVMWPFWEAATASLPAKVKAHVLKRYWEPVVYNLERSLAPWVIGG